MKKYVLFHIFFIDFFYDLFAFKVLSFGSNFYFVNIQIPEFDKKREFLENGREELLADHIMEIKNSILVSMNFIR